MKNQTADSHKVVEKTPQGSRKKQGFNRGLETKENKSEQGHGLQKTALCHGVSATAQASINTKRATVVAAIANRSAYMLANESQQKRCDRSSKVKPKKNKYKTAKGKKANKKPTEVDLTKLHANSPLRGRVGFGAGIKEGDQIIASIAIDDDLEFGHVYRCVGVLPDSRILVEGIGEVSSAWFLKASSHMGQRILGFVAAKEARLASAG